MNYLNCPRCGDRSYERLHSYSHCVLCGYSPIFNEIDQEIEDLRDACRYLDSQSVKLKFPEIQKVVTPPRRERTAAKKPQTSN